MDHASPRRQHDADADDRDGIRALTIARRRWPLAALALFALCGFSALGVWQIERRVWKLDLIARVEARIHAAPVPLPARSGWPTLRAPDFEYRRVRASGTFRAGHDTLVQAVTQDGAGFWVMTPLRTAEGTVLVNRGFVPGERAEARSRALPPPPGSAVVVGLLRASEPGGGFLRANAPASGRWYSRDVAAIARATGVEPVAPFFIDADRSAIPGYPQGGMTTVHFANNHLVYAATWFALAALSGLAAWRLANERPDR